LENNITPKEYVLNSIDNIKDDIINLKKVIISGKVLGTVSFLEANVFEVVLKLLNNEWGNALIPLPWALFGCGFVYETIMRSELNSLEVRNDMLQEKVELSDIAVKSKGNVNESRKYLVKKIRTLEENIDGYKKNIKLWLLGAGISFIASMVCHDNTFIKILGLVVSYFFAEKGIDFSFKAIRDNHIIDRISTTLDIDEVKRTRKMPKNT